MKLFHGHKLTGVVMALSEVKLRNLKPKEKAYQESDGGGMFVEVLPGGEKFGACVTVYSANRKKSAWANTQHTVWPKPVSGERIALPW